MKFKIKGEEKEENHIELWLEKDSLEEGIILKGRDSEGKVRDIIYLSTSGKFGRDSSCDLKGLELDEDSRIKEHVR